MKRIWIRSASEKGDSAVITISLVVAGIILVMCLWKIGVPVFKYMQLSSFAKDELNYNRENAILNATMIRIMHDKVYNRAVSLKLPVKENQIVVDREGERATMKIDYVYPIDMFILSFDFPFHFNHTSEGVGFQ
jgi:hypothetical protein